MIYISLQFYLASLQGKNYFAKEPELEPGVFGPLEPEPLKKKYQEPEPEPLGKKIRSRSRLKKSQEPEPDQLKNLPAPLPCSSPFPCLIQF